MEFPIDIPAETVRICEQKLIARNGGAIRLGVKGGGCSGFSYVVEFEDRVARKTDLTVTLEGTEFRIDPKSALILSGSTFEYFDDGLKGKGFRFLNPQEKNRCGCGTSFNV